MVNEMVRSLLSPKLGHRLTGGTEIIRNKTRASVYRIDLCKNVFHVVGTDQTGSVVQRVKFRRETLLAFFERSEPVLIGMEACSRSQWLARNSWSWATRSGLFLRNL